MSLLEVKDLAVSDTRSGKDIVQCPGFTVETDACLGIVGESGSGKSLICKALMGLAAPGITHRGEIRFQGINLLTAPANTVNAIRGKRICMILQDAMTAFSPLSPLGSQLTRALRQKTGLNRKQAAQSILSALSDLEIRDPKAVAGKYPHQLSGGMLQRCMIALTLALGPDLIIADEPTTALDSITRQAVVSHLSDIRKRTGSALIFVSHDLGVVGHLAQNVLVMHQGRQVEYADCRQVFTGPCHARTRDLVRAHAALTRRFRQVAGPADYGGALNGTGELPC